MVANGDRPETPAMAKLKILALASGLESADWSGGSEQTLKVIDDMEAQAKKIIDDYGAAYKKYDVEILNECLTPVIDMLRKMGDSKSNGAGDAMVVQPQIDALAQSVEKLVDRIDKLEAKVDAETD